MVKNVNAKQLEQELSNYLRSGKNTPLFVASYTGMGKTEIIQKVSDRLQLSNNDLKICNGYRSVNPEGWKVVWFQDLINIASDIDLIVREKFLLPTIVEVSLTNADCELEVNPIYNQYEKEEWLLYRPTFEEWLQWAEQEDDSGTPNVNPQIVDFIRWAGEKVLYDSILCGSYDRELGILNDAQLWPDKNYRYEGAELTKASEEKKKEISKQLNNLGKDEIGSPLDPRKNRFIHYNPRKWKEISDSYDGILMGILIKNDDSDWDYLGCLDKSEDEYNVNYIHPNVLSEAIRHIPEERWPSIITKYLPNFHIQGKEITDCEKDEFINNIMIHVIEVGTRSEQSLPSIMFKEYLQRPKES